MDLAKKVLERADDFPIKSDKPAKVGKVRCVYDIGDKLVMIITDKISAFDVNWHTENGVKGIYRKGLNLNKQSEFWFKKLKENDLGDNHISEVIHPYVWLVDKAEPVMIEAIFRNYITGSMWRAYEKGERVFCGYQLPEGFKKNAKLIKPLFTPTTKGILKIEGVPEKDDTPITFKQMQEKWKEFGFKSEGDAAVFRDRGFAANEEMYMTALELKKILVDHKFELGYIHGELRWIDEAGTQDSSRIWDKDIYENQGRAVEESKEFFRSYLLDKFGKETLTGKNRDMDELRKLAEDHSVDITVWDGTSDIYDRWTSALTGKKADYAPDDIRSDISDALSDAGLLK